jgi:hypothetical protein
MMVSKKKQLEEIIEKLRNLDQQHEKNGGQVLLLDILK